MYWRITMTEKQIKTYKSLSLKQKIARSRDRSKLVTEISNYENAIKQNTAFKTYHEFRLAELNKQLEEFDNED